VGVTHLAAWLAFSPKEIVGRIARDVERAPSAKLVVLGLDPPSTAIEPRGALIFERRSILPASIVGKAISRAHEAISVEEAARLIAERKQSLRRAAVYAAWVESEAKRHGISADDLIRLDAMATYGFASEWDIPVEARYSIQYKRSELSELHWAGLFVLNVSKSLAETPR
jgi:hypothetical protein